MLLSFGAKPGLRDARGRSAEDLAEGDDDLGLMLALYEDEGPVAFEDPPGTWRANVDPETGASQVSGVNRSSRDNFRLFAVAYRDDSCATSSSAAPGANSVVERSTMTFVQLRQHQPVHD